MRTGGGVLVLGGRPAEGEAGLSNGGGIVAFISLPSPSLAYRGASHAQACKAPWEGFTEEVSAPDLHFVQRMNCTGALTALSLISLMINALIQ